MIKKGTHAEVKSGEGKKAALTVVTHGSGFHADDVFGVAAILMAYPEKRIKILRSLDEALIASADIVLDIGGVDDPRKNRFDHHQEGGAGARPSGVSYAAFGLIWKKFGKKLAGSQELADRIDESLVAPLDARDNGQDLYSEASFPGVYPVEVVDYVGLEAIAAKDFPAKGKEKERHVDRAFMRLLPFARRVIELEIAKARSGAAARKQTAKAYQKAGDKRIIVSDEFFPADFDEYPDVRFFIYKDMRGGWSAKNIRLSPHSYAARLSFPEAWRGKSDGELAAASGVPDAVFCHNSGFLAVAKSKEGAVRLAELALEKARG